METSDFEKGFADFLNSVAYDEAENALVKTARLAYIYGWQAATRYASEHKDEIE